MSQDSVLLLLRLLFATVSVVVVAVFVVRPILRVLRQKPDLDLLIPDYTQALEGEELEIPQEIEQGMPNRADVIAEARADPQKTAMLVQRWLKQRK